MRVHNSTIVFNDRFAWNLTDRDLDGDRLPEGRLRWLLPVETERLMGFPDGWTAPPSRMNDDGDWPWGPRYACTGNSWAVNVADWVLTRIGQAEGLLDADGEPVSDLGPTERPG